MSRKHYYTENPCLDAIDYIRTLSIEQISNMSVNKDLDYAKTVSNYAFNYSNKKGYKRVSYNQKNNIGRQYSDKISFQNIQKDWRGLLCRSNYQDLDMINSLPSILLHLVSTKYPDLSCYCLYRYVKNREQTLELLNIDKKEFLIKYIMCDRNPKVGNREENPNSYSQQLLMEMNLIKNTLYRDITETDIKNLDPKCKNPKSSYLAKMCFNIENEILCSVIKKIGKKNIGALCFDGLIIDNDYKIDLDMINNITKEYNIKWAIKSFSDKINIPIDYKSQVLTALETKETFEKNHFIIRQPLTYCCIEADGSLNTTSDNKKFQSLTAPFFNPEIYSFNSWLSDPNRREYRKFDFIPYVLADSVLGTKLDCFNKPKDKSIYNMAKPYESEYLNKKDLAYDNTAIKWFIDFIKSNICPQREGSEDDWKWLLNFIIYKLKNPNMLHGVAILVKGKMGSGKDSLIAILDKIMGNDYIYNQQETKHILGEVNTSLKNKLHIVLNEMSGAVGFSFCEQLKDLITRETNNIKELYKDPYEMPNLSTLWVLSNNMNPIQLPKDNRRWVLFVTSDKNKGNTAYWNDIYSNINNPDFINSLYTQLLDYKIPADFNPRDTALQPRSNMYFDMQHAQIDPIFKFLYNMDYTDLSGYINNKNSKWDKFYYSNKTDFKKLFNKWTGDESKIKTQKITAKLNEIELGVFENKSLNIDGRKYNNMILFNKELILEYLKKEYFSNMEDDEIIINNKNDLDLNTERL